jgi:hypothetical protein
MLQALSVPQKLATRQYKLKNKNAQQVSRQAVKNPPSNTVTTINSY